MDGGEIWFKTDDTALFTESMPYFDACGFELRYLTSDPHARLTPNYISEHDEFGAGRADQVCALCQKPGRWNWTPCAGDAGRVRPPRSGRTDEE
ncbi:MAG: hypothetical protein ACLS7Z_12385 [Christensenellales bacterium]